MQHTGEIIYLSGSGEECYASFPWRCAWIEAVVMMPATSGPRAVARSRYIYKQLLLLANSSALWYNSQCMGRNIDDALVNIYLWRTLQQGLHCCCKSEDFISNICGNWCDFIHVTLWYGRTDQKLNTREWICFIWGLSLAAIISQHCSTKQEHRCKKWKTLSPRPR